jgi:hypothetical protein
MWEDSTSLNSRSCSNRPTRSLKAAACSMPGWPPSLTRSLLPLVLETQAGSGGGFAVRVAYGTKSLDYVTRGKIDLIIDSPEDIDICGLAVATRFDLENIATIPWEPPHCDCWRGRLTPILGELPMAQQVECAYKLAAIQNKAANK